LLGGAPLTGRRVTVLGLGLQGGGVEVVRALAAERAAITVSDRRDERALAPALALLRGLPVRYALGGHDPRDLLEAEVVVANPAIPPGSPELCLARGAGARVTSETELFLENTRGRVALVTGTQGKSTTCHLTHALLAGAGLESGARAHLGGNIGRSLLNALDLIGPDDVVVLEISSYQLEALPGELAPLARSVAAGCVTNVLADHLERHGSLEAYSAAKRRIADLVPRGAPLVLPAADERVRAWDLDGPRPVRFDAEGAAELSIEGGSFCLAGEPLARVADLALSGGFQRANALAALGLARLLGARTAGLGAALGACRGLPHRFECLGPRGGHEVWDNGVSTTPDSTISVIEALAERGRSFALLAGGQAKTLPLEGLVRVAGERARRVVTFGRSGAELARAFRGGGVAVLEGGELGDAVRLAYRHMEAGEALLFSPACASFDAYLNFAERAAAFRAALPP
jgi:UDP-N-acetylmuramoylalanine--D-glutamate ligase